MRLLLQHRSHYRFPQPAALGPHLVRLKPASHVKAKIESYGLKVPPACQLRWQQDPYGNHVARITVEEGVKLDALDLEVQLAVDIRPVNPFDFFLDDRARDLPFEYPRELVKDLQPFFDRQEASFAVGPRFEKLLATLPRAGATVSWVVAANEAVHQGLKYVIREEPGIWTPEETLAHGRGSCRDFATLLIALLRARGLAARFVSGYLVQLTDEGMLPDEPKGVSRDVIDLHAWAEVFLPGAGWLGLDATSGLLCGEGHLPLACTALPALAAPVDGTTDVVASEVSFEMKVQRLGHEPRPTAPYEEPVWLELLERAKAADLGLEAAGVKLTSGGEPTFNSREHPGAPEWNGEALGPTKWKQALTLCEQLRARFDPHAAVLLRTGKHYPGESLPRWAIDLYSRADGRPLWSGALHGEAGTDAKAQTLAEALSSALGLSGSLAPAYEDPWRFLQEEARLPADVDPLTADLKDSEERRRLARVLDRGLGAVVGWALPLRRTSGEWETEQWALRRGHLFLVPGDSPIGLRLPLASLGPGDEVLPKEPEGYPADPRRAAEKKAQLKRAAAASSPPPRGPIRTALCVENREGALRVFLPPLADAGDFIALVELIDRVRRELQLRVLLEGYPPASGAVLKRLAVTPDPGVLEVNLPPASSGAEHAQLLSTVFDAALHSGLHCEKYLLDGRVAGSGGGHHLTLGGPSALESPFVKRPDLLASLLTLVQHHPSLSFLFTGLFVGPTSQAPRLDEARHDALHELEIALARAFEPGPSPPPWLSDLLFRHLLVDVSGNTHRTEVSIDKLFDWRSPFGRQGLIELRAFEMPPHPRMAAAQAILVRALIAAVARKPYRAGLVRYGPVLHDRFLLPHFLWADFQEVLATLRDRGVELPEAAYRPFLELRCPVVGQAQFGDVTVELRNALEPWHVLGEESGASGTSRYVDSSMERVELRAAGLTPERHRVLVNGRVLPMRPTGIAAEQVAGVRFRAWAPPHSLHAHLGIHHPLRFDVVDTWGQRSVGAVGYHVWHPEGRAFDSPPLTRFEAAARRAQRFTLEAPLSAPVVELPSTLSAEAPYTLDLRRFPGDSPLPGGNEGQGEGD
jgi:uncharacterized protein (DUF2126 family)/transglutaminase-like putative cysteine protease